MSVPEPNHSELPTLAFVYNAHSFATLALADAADGLCRLLWVIDSSEPEVASMARLLRRLGTCVDIADLSLDEAALLVGEQRPDGILALADDSLRITADLAERLGLAFATPAAVSRLTDKYVQRVALAAVGLAVPRSWILGDANSATTLAEVERENPFPAVIKPRQGQGSRDTLPVGSVEELRNLFGTLGWSADGREFVLEEYIADAYGAPAGEGFGGYVSVESIISHDVVSHLAVTGRMPPAHPFRETGFFIPSALGEKLRRAVLEVAERAVSGMGVSSGCFHTEIKLTPSGPVIIEVNGRIGGGVPEMLAAATGIKFLELSMRLALGEKLVIEQLPLCVRVAYLFYVQAPLEFHTVSAIHGLDDLQAVPGVDEIVLNRGPGRRVDWREGNFGHVFSVLGTCADHDELRRIKGLVASLVRIEGQ